MDEAFELADHLPLSFKTQDEQAYIAFLWDVFETNYETGSYQFSFLAYHMLTMCFIYFNIWQIKQTWLDDFKKGLIGFTREENDFLKATSPFVFSQANERTILRLFKLIECDNDKIGNYAKLVDDRNKVAHPNGHILFKTKEALDDQINEVLRVVNEIQLHSRPVIEQCYREFLCRSSDSDEPEYFAPDDQIREVLIHDHYLSQKDIEFCMAFDIKMLRKRTGFNQIEILHKSLCEAYGTREDNE